MVSMATTLNYGHNTAEKIMWTKNSNDTIGNQTRDHLACSIVPPPPARLPLHVRHTKQIQ
jgi:hypothetical protein